MLSNQMPLPAELLRAISDPAGGRVVLVIGAGCSADPPTDLPLASQCAEEACRRLETDHILRPGACANPRDLSSVADAVVEATGHQRPLVERLPRDHFRHARPNEGHLLAAVMLCEGSISSVMTLNFDRAMDHALSVVGARGVSVIAGPEQYSELGLVNLIYLHRNVEADPELWILRTSALEAEWRDTWQETLATRVLVTPVVVFAGLGTPAAVLVETVRRIRKSLPADRVHIYQVDIVEADQSAFFAALGIPLDAYLNMSWTEFMRQLAARLLEEHLTALMQACKKLCDREGWNENVEALCNRAREAGLIRVGELRASWFLDMRGYLPHREVDPDLVADLFLGIALMERVASVEANFEQSGIVEFRREGRVIGSALPVSGRGNIRWHAIEGEIRRSEFRWRYRNPRPGFAIIAGVPGGRPAVIGPPADVVREDAPENVVEGQGRIRLVDVDELRRNPELSQEVLR